MSMTMTGRKATRNSASVATATLRTNVGTSPIRVQVKSRSKAKARVTHYVLSRSTILLSTLVLSYFSATVAGNMMLQSKTNDLLVAQRRLSVASGTESRLMKHVETLLSTSTVQDWVDANGYVAMDATTAPILAEVPAPQAD